LWRRTRRRKKKKKKKKKKSISRIARGAPSYLLQ